MRRYPGRGRSVFLRIFTELYALSRCWRLLPSGKGWREGGELGIGIQRVLLLEEL
jgi:hypothetical protein